MGINIDFLKMAGKSFLLKDLIFTHKQKRNTLESVYKFLLFLIISQHNF